MCLSQPTEAFPRVDARFNGAGKPPPLDAAAIAEQDRAWAEYTAQAGAFSLVSMPPSISPTLPLNSQLNDALGLDDAAEPPAGLDESFEDTEHDLSNDQFVEAALAEEDTQYTDSTPVPTTTNVAALALATGRSWAAIAKTSKSPNNSSSSLHSGEAEQLPPRSPPRSPHANRTPKTSVPYAQSAPNHSALVPHQTAFSSGASPAAPAAVVSPLPAPVTRETVNPKDWDWDQASKRARHFIIKSYTEDDVRQSLRYNVWASTDGGNRRLDAAFREHQGIGPVFLYFSVNGSGHFCGMAQMTSPLDFTKKVDVWASDKWNGCFTIKWIFVKSVPNNACRHIKLENNENKPVTNSRDTQEVLAVPGRDLIRILATYSTKSSLLDDPKKNVEAPAAAEPTKPAAPKGRR